MEKFIQKTIKVFIIITTFTDTKFFSQNGQGFELPEGKFDIRSTLDKESNTFVEWYRKVVNKKNRG